MLKIHDSKRTETISHCGLLYRRAENIDSACPCFDMDTGTNSIDLAQQNRFYLMTEIDFSL
jgi:hypothetical protein